MAYFGYKVKFEELRSFDSSTFTGSYQTFGDTFSNPIVLFKIQNDSDADATISFDGSTDQEVVLAGSFVLYDLSANKLLAPIAALSKGTQVYIKGTAGTGNIYLTAIYIEER